MLDFGQKSRIDLMPGGTIDGHWPRHRLTIDPSPEVIQQSIDML